MAILGTFQSHNHISVSISGSLQHILFAAVFRHVERCSFLGYDPAVGCRWWSDAD